MSPISHPLVDIFLLGFITACSLVAATFFLRFWKSTRDKLFLAFALFFIVQGAKHAFVVSLSDPSEGSLSFSLVRLVSILIVLGAILWKNSVNR